MEIVFEQEELRLCSVDSRWDGEALLQQSGLFDLKDITRPLGLRSSQVAEIKAFCRNDPEGALAVGLRRALSVTFVRMSLFAGYFREQFGPSVREVDPSWDANRLLSEKGVFLLASVVKRLPVTSSQLRYQARNQQNGRQEMGVWKQGKTWLIDMAVFAPWIKIALRGENGEVR